MESIGGKDGEKKEITMWWNTGKKVDSVYTAPELASGETGQISLRRRSLEFKSRLRQDQGASVQKTVWTV